MQKNMDELYPTYNGLNTKKEGDFLYVEREDAPAPSPTPYIPSSVPNAGTSKDESYTDSSNLVDRAVGDTERAYKRLQSMQGERPSLSQLFLKNNPKPQLDKNDIETQRKRANYALATEALRLMVDIGSGLGGGNIYRREPTAAAQVKESQAIEDRIRQSFANNVAHWRKAYEQAALADANKDKGDYVNLFGKIYNGLLGQEKEGGINQRFYDRLDWRDGDREDEQEHQIFMQGLKGTQREKMARLAAYFRERARQSQDNEVVNRYFPGIGWVRMRAIDAEYAKKLEDQIAYQHGGYLPTKIDPMTGKIISPNRYEQNAAAANAVSQGKGLTDLRNAVSTYPLNGGKKTLIDKTMKPQTNNNQDKWITDLNK